MNTPNFAELANQAAAQKDFTDVQTGGNFKTELPEAGICVLRLREYIEMGLCKAATQTYPNKKPVQKARFTFEILTPRHVKLIEKEGEASFKIAPTISIIVPIGDNEKSNYIKLFKQLNWEGKATHPAQCLGKGYLAEIVHAGANKGEITKDNPAKYANLQKDGVYTLSAPRKVDALAGTSEPVNVPELINGMKLFLQGNPTQECWDSLFIDGEYEKDGKPVSKNWMQRMLREALDFETSMLKEMLDGGGELLEDSLTTEATDKSEDEQPVDPAAPVDPLEGLC